MSTTDDSNTADDHDATDTQHGKPTTAHGHYRPDGEEPHDPRGPHELACERASPSNAEGGNPPQPLTVSATTFLQNNPDIAFNIPDAGQPWRVERLPIAHRGLMELKQRGLIRRGPRQATGDGDSSHTYRIWWTKPATARAIAALDEPPTCPEGCYATGVRCLEAGELYTCLTDDCGCRFGRDRAQAILAGDER